VVTLQTTVINLNLDVAFSVQPQPQEGRVTRASSSWLRSRSIGTSRATSEAVSDIDPTARTDASPSHAPGVLAPDSTSNQTTVFDGVHARAFEKWNRTLPCVPAERDWYLRQQDPTVEGLVFVKPYKTGSSTASGVNLRIARNIARRLKSNNESQIVGDSTTYVDLDMCKARSDHAWAAKNYGKRDPSRAFVWTILREPDSRIVSQFFHFDVSRKKKEPSDENFADYITNGSSSMMHDHYLDMLSLRPYARGQDDPVKIANEILRSYNFVGVTERMDESLVALAMILGVPIADVTYLSAKSSGGFDDGGQMSDGDKTHTCTYIWPSFVSEGMESVLNSENWRRKSRWDRALHDAANRSLDLTIESLGRPLFEEQLALYRQAQDRSRVECLHKTRFPCSPGGAYAPRASTSCLWKDSGCGYACLDEVADELQLWETVP
jgi:hypothetical protein